MTIRFRALLPLVALILAFQAPAAAQQELPDSLRIVVLGSSTAAGAGANPRDSAWVWRYTAFLKSLDPDYTVVNLARGGYTTYHLQPDAFTPPDGRPAVDSARNITRALALSPSAIIINLPSNDAALNFSIIEQSQNFERLAEQAAAAQVPLWVCTTQPRNMSDAQRQNLITMRDWITNRFGSKTLDFWSDLAVEDGSLLSAYNSGDGVHLNNAGHGLLFERVRDARIPESLQQTTWIAETALAGSLELTPFPQPARDGVTFRIRTTHSGSLSLRLYDMLGRNLRSIERAYQMPGESYHRLRVADLPRGMYQVVLESGSQVLRGRLLLTR